MRARGRPAELAAPPPAPDVERRRGAELGAEEDRTVEAVDIALAAACAVASAEPRPRIALRLRTSAGVEVWVLSTEDGAAAVHRAPGGDADDADARGALECSLGTFLRLASNRLKMSRAVLSGLAKVPRARPPERGEPDARARRSRPPASLERWGPVLREAKRAVAASLGLRRPSADAREAAFASAAAQTVGAPRFANEERAGPLYRRGGWRAAVSAIKGEAAGGRWRLRVQVSPGPDARVPSLLCRATSADLAAASEAACAVELRRELATLLGGVARALGLEADDRIERRARGGGVLGGRVLSVAVSEADGAALDFVVGEVAKAWTQLTRPETRDRAALGDVANARSDSERQVDDYHQGKVCPRRRAVPEGRPAPSRASAGPAGGAGDPGRTMQGWTEKGTGHGMSLGAMHSPEAQKIWADLKPMAPEAEREVLEPTPAAAPAAPGRRQRAPAEARRFARARRTSTTCRRGPRPRRRPRATRRRRCRRRPRSSSRSRSRPARSPRRHPRPLSSQLGKGSFMFGKRWAKGHWTFNRQHRELVQYADGGEREVLGQYALAPDCELRLSKADPRLAVELTAVIKRNGAPGLFSSGGDDPPQPLTLKAATVAECSAWKLALEAVLRVRQTAEARRQAAAGFDAAAAPPAAAPPPAAPAKAPSARCRPSRALEKLLALRATFDDLERAVGEVEFGLRSGNDAAWKAEAKADVAQINGRLDKLQFAGIDAVVTTDIKDDAKKSECKTKRKALNQDVESLRTRIGAAYSQLKG
ncbi:hypothetical protein SO694_00059156 [Aureococcus anophagefferens]|uniref:PH domain-containing protein n=1 Tax=Aureococcus anophagefferens TaxID=44056 RepID=A0ABR1FYY6_AURAN